MADTVLNQTIYQTNQNFDIDINKIFTDFIQQIDAVRSIINIQVNINSSLLNKFDIKTVNSLGAKLKIGTTAQESRVHAFYRLLGLPVISKSGQFYNPGLDNIGGTKKIKPADKVSIANGVDSDFSILSLQRENYINGILQIYNQNPSTITASALALSSSIHTRAFSIPTTNTSSTSFNPSDQQYTPIFDSIVGQYHVLLNNYMDANGNLPSPSLFKMPRYHFIQPFMVDPRIAFTVNPASNLVAVPFVPTKQNLFIQENTYVKRPLIEKIIRDRHLNIQDTVITSGQQKIINQILNSPNVMNDSLISQMVNSPYIKNNSAQFEKYLLMIQAMCVQLIKSKKDIQKAQGEYYWIPAPAINIGPEGGSDVQGIIISSTMPNNLITIADRAIINQTLNQASNNFDTASAAADGVPDLGGFAFEGGSNFFDLTFDQSTSTSLGDITTTQLTNLNKRRDQYLGVANSALQNIEIIMGEWSGLGFCDIVAIMAALYTMDQDMLLGFLDDDALQRCNTELGIDPFNAPRIDVALPALIQSVNNYYHLMDAIFNNLSTINKQFG